MYFARKNHKLSEWREFCKWCETLPYFSEICIEPVEKGEIHDGELKTRLSELDKVCKNHDGLDVSEYVW